MRNPSYKFNIKNQAKMTNLISFDWAMKRVLRDKANHAVLEGLMTSLLNEKFTIVRFLESVIVRW